ncbi:uncharacterized protein K452DRAFT_321742 [Aplosporella prunicola CBS 121167]|uniref:Hydrophobin n=1 Tax=Aplosporella prunicola CBS 121167 TaxID=1176127 RepID=A0A6A6AZY3_9PEZI|nr:uncharacterized protein K452DRAFT_321742 [Aplosporella prunicola CBS 121167]KAF2137502.1 hypothetical protein K452DRAFT_321742 [Aplosporella prunicola CBS 121167]
MKFTGAITAFAIVAAVAAAPGGLEARTDKIGSSASTCSTGSTSLKCCNTSAQSCSNLNNGAIEKAGLGGLLNLLSGILPLDLLSNAQLTLLSKNGCDSNSQVACCSGASLVNVCSPINVL